MNYSTNPDPKLLMELVQEMGRTILTLSEISARHSLMNKDYLQGIVNNVFDTFDVKATLTEIKAYNEGHPPEWMELNEKVD